MRYLFNVTDGHAVAADHEGSEQLDAHAIRDEALRTARDLMSDSDRLGRCRRHWRVDVLDEAGGVVFVLPFSQALAADYMPIST